MLLPRYGDVPSVQGTVRTRLWVGLERVRSAEGRRFSDDRQVASDWWDRTTARLKLPVVDHESLPVGRFLSHFADFEVLRFDQLLDAISNDPAAALVVPLSGTNVIPAE